MSSLVNSPKQDSLFSAVSLPAGYRVGEENKTLRDDTRIDLKCGEILDDSGAMYFLPSIVRLQNKVNPLSSEKHYPETLGLQSFLRQSEKLVFGDEVDGLASAQTIGGAGGLSLAAITLKRILGSSDVIMDDLSWGDHARIFKMAGFNVHTHNYLTPDREVDLAAIVKSITTAQKGSLILFQPCAHNPTGIVPDGNNWNEILKLCKEQKVFPLFDLAYLGLGRGVHEDLVPIRLAIGMGIEFGVVTSFCKIFGMYGHRLGTLTLKINDSTAAEKLIEQLKITVRATYSSPPIYPARIGEMLLNSSEIFENWQSDLQSVRELITLRRHALDRLLKDRGVDLSLRAQSGVFAWTGLSREQVRKLSSNHGVVIPSNGRISLGKLLPEQIERVAEAISHVITE